MQNHYNLVYRGEEREMIPQCIRPGCCGHPVEPAGARAARRQPHARGRTPDDAREHGRLRRRRSTARRSTSPSSTASPKWRRSAASRAPRSRSPGSCRGRGSPLRSSGRRRPPTSRTRLRLEQLQLSDAEVARLEEPYVPHRNLGALAESERAATISDLGATRPPLEADVHVRRVGSIRSARRLQAGATMFSVATLGLVAWGKGGQRAARRPNRVHSSWRRLW